jgi:hypothetical protein
MQYKIGMFYAIEPCTAILSVEHLNL